MEKIELGSLAKTKIDKYFEFEGEQICIPKGSIVRICDVYDLAKGFVLVEFELFADVFDYEIDEITILD